MCTSIHYSDPRSRSSCQCKQLVDLNLQKGAIKQLQENKVTQFKLHKHQKQSENMQELWNFSVFMY